MTTSTGLAQHRLDAIDFDVAVVTNITHEHLYFHQTWENYRDAKAMLFRSLATSFHKPRTAKVAVLNVDDNERGVFEFLSEIPAEEQIVYWSNDRNQMSSVIGHRSSVSIFAHDIEHSPRGLRFTVETPHGQLQIESPPIGRYNVSNILAANRRGNGTARAV